MEMPEGWDVGPAEPTTEMLKAGCIAGLAIETLLDDKPYACEAAIYKAMRAASPTPPGVPKTPSADYINGTADKQ